LVDRHFFGFGPGLAIVRDFGQVAQADVNPPAPAVKNPGPQSPRQWGELVIQHRQLAKTSNFKITDAYQYSS